MEILFVYIEKYNGIEKKGISLSSKFIISFDEKNKKLYIKESQFNLSSKFNANILDIKAIVGANGSGKTTLLKYLFEKGHTTILNIQDDYPKDFVIYLRDNVIVISSNDKYKILPSDIIDTRDSKGNILYCYFKEGFEWSKLHEFNKTGFIYFSNLFDNNYTEELRDSVNITTNYLIKKDKEIYYNSLSHDGFEQLDCFRINELKRQLNFINHNSDTVLEFKLPELLQMTIFDSERNRDRAFLENVSKEFSLEIEKFKNSKDPKEIEKLSSKEIIEQIEYYASLSNLIKKLNDFSVSRDLQNNPRKFYLDGLIITSVLNFVRYFHENFKVPSIDLTGEKNKLLKIVTENIIDSNVNIPNIIAQLIVYEKELSKNNEPHISNLFLADFGKINDFIIISEKLIISLEHFDKPPFLNHPFIIPTSNGIIKEWLDIYLFSKKGADFLDFTWRDLSSGELARLNLLSRFYDALGKETIIKKDNYIILIDEGDIFLHPNWQRKFINILNNDLAPLFGNKKIQIILTSHSPFITSDLTKSHLYFFTPIGNENDIHKETFAQNIFTLFNDSFYLESPIGEFAQNIIQDIIDILNKKKEFENKIELKNIIDSIGEQFIREKLSNMYYENYPKEYLTEMEKREKIIELKEQIRRLEK